MARPTKYNESILAKANDYLVNYEDYDDAVPSAAGLSIELGITRETLNQWSKDEDKQELSDTLRKIQQKQERVLASKGLKGEFNAAITKLMLANHGYSEKTQQEMTGANGTPLIPDTIKVIYE